MRLLIWATLGVLICYGGLLFLTYRGFTTTPTGFIPAQDKGYLIVNVQLPDAASLQRTKKVMDQINGIVLKTPGVAHTVGITGQSLILGANGSNFATMFLTLAPFEERVKQDGQGAFAILGKLQGELAREVQDAQVLVFPPPAVSGLGNAGGFKIMVEDRGDLGVVELEQQVNALMVAAEKDPDVQFAFSSFRAKVPQLFVDVDRARALQMGVPLQSVFGTLQIFLGSAYVNDFNKDGRTWQVTAQADAKFRTTAEYVHNLKVKNDQGEMVPLGSIVNVRDAAGPVVIQRYNNYLAAALNGNFATGVSTGQGIERMEQLSDETLVRRAATEWTELSLLQTREGPQAIYAFFGAVILVYLVLAGQYNSWAVPLSVILVVPMCLLSSIAAVRYMGKDINIFTQVGFIVLVGLACKNAILIVEFAQQLRAEGKGLKDAILEACQLRLRPIVMTSVAFILGVSPLLIAEGAGSEMRQALGLAVFGGMIGVTLFGIFLTPVFYFAIQWATGGQKSPPTVGEPQPDHPPAASGREPESRERPAEPKKPAEPPRREVPADAPVRAQGGA